MNGPMIKWIPWSRLVEMHPQIPLTRLIFLKGCRSLGPMLALMSALSLSGSVMFRIDRYYCSLSASCLYVEFFSSSSQFAPFRAKYELQQFMKPSLRILSATSTHSLQASMSMSDSFRSSASSQLSVCLIRNSQSR